MILDLSGRVRTLAELSKFQEMTGHRGGSGDGTYIYYEDQATGHTGGSGDGTYGKSIGGRNIKRNIRAKLFESW